MFLTAFMAFLLDGFRDDVSWNASKGRQLKVTFHNSLNGWSMNVQLFSDLSGALACPWLVFCEQISSPTCSIISGVRTDLGRPLPGFLVRDDPVSSTRLQITLTVSSFQFFSGYFAEIARYPIPCSRDIAVLTHAMSGFSFYRPRKLYPWLRQSVFKILKINISNKI